MAAENDAVDGFHQIKRSAEHGKVITEKKDLRGRRVVSVKFRKHAKLAAHIVSGFYFAPKRRPAKNHFARTQLDGICEIGVAARVLADDEISGLVSEMAAKKRLQLGEVEFLAWSN